jgi:CO/xanthine dehydrogenase Mo-binding subunit
MVKAASKWLAAQSAYPRSGRYPHREWPRRNSALLLQFSRHSFGAHFCEVPFDPEIARLRISRWLTVVDGGRMINMKTSRIKFSARSSWALGWPCLKKQSTTTVTASR